MNMSILRFKKALQNSEEPRHYRLIRAFSAFGIFVCLYFIFNAFFQFDECIECKIIHNNLKLPPIILAALGIVVFFYYLLETKYSQFLTKYKNFISVCVFASESILLSIQIKSQMFCIPCMSVCILFFIILFLSYKESFSTVLSFATALCIVISLICLNTFETKQALIDDAMIAEHTDEHKYLIIQSSCKHCERLLEELNNRNLLNSVNILSLDRPSQIVHISTSIKNTIYKNADWTNYSERGLKNFLSSIGIERTPVLLVKSNEQTMSFFFGVEDIIEELTK